MLIRDRADSTVDQEHGSLIHRYFSDMVDFIVLLCYAEQIATPLWNCQSGSGTINSTYIFKKETSYYLQVYSITSLHFIGRLSIVQLWIVVYSKRKIQTVVLSLMICAVVQLKFPQLSTLWEKCRERSLFTRCFSSLQFSEALSWCMYWLNYLHYSTVKYQICKKAASSLREMRIKLWIKEWDVCKIKSAVKRDLQSLTNKQTCMCWYANYHALV